MATFPSYARLLVEGYGEESDYGVLRTEMDGGVAKQRARWSKPIVTRDATLMVASKSEKFAFDDWMRDDLAGGAGWFDWIEPLSGATKQARIVGGKVKWSTPGKAWKSHCQIETVG